MFDIGIDLGGTNIAVGIVDESGKMIYKDSRPTLAQRPAQEVIADMGALCLKVLRDSGISEEQIASIGIGIPGPTDNQNGVIPFCANLGWDNVPIRSLLHDVIDKPIYLENDANVAALAEAQAGICAGAQNCLFITLGTGVGGGVIVGGKLLRGHFGKGGELGHFIYQPDGEICPCGLKGCWERYASATALIRTGKQIVGENDAHPIAVFAGGIDKIQAYHIIECAKNGDADAKAVFDDYCRHVAMGLVSLTNIFDPQIIAVGGGVSGAGEYLLEPVRRIVDELTFCRFLGTPRIEKALLGNDAGLIGAAALRSYQ